MEDGLIAPDGRSSAFDSAAGGMKSNPTSMRVDSMTGAWYVDHQTMQYTVYPDALVRVAEALKDTSSRTAVLTALTDECQFALSRSGKSVTVRGPETRAEPRDANGFNKRIDELNNRGAHVAAVADALASIVWAAYISPRWRDLERLARLMAESPAPRKNRGADSYRPVPIRHGGLI